MIRHVKLWALVLLRVAVLAATAMLWRRASSRPVSAFTLGPEGELVARLQDIREDYDEASEQHTESASLALVDGAIEFLSELKDAAPLQPARLHPLRELIAKKGKPWEAWDMAKSLENEVIQKYRLPTAPPRWPSLAQGAQLYANMCAACHGREGEPTGEIALQMEPPPVNLRRDLEHLAKVSPFRAYQAVTYGVVGTSMPSYSLLSDEERWALAFYAMALAHPECNVEAPKVSLEVVSRSTNWELVESHGGEALSCLRRGESRVRGNGQKAQSTLRE